MDAKVSPASSSSSSYFPNDNASLAAYVIASIIALLVAGYFYYDNQFKYFKRLGLKNPKPLPVVGNLFRIYTKNRMAYERENLAKCGKFYGIFQGAQPRFVCADPEVLRQICIKDFDKFPNHDAKSRLLNDYMSKFIFFMQDDIWRRTRTLQTPTFTSGKIKRMYKLLDKCADDLVDCFGDQLVALTQQEQQPNNNKFEPKAIVNVREIFELFTMDGIASCGYGLKLERKGSASVKSAASRNEFVAITLKMFKLNWLRLLAVATINKQLLNWIGFTSIPNSSVDPLADKVRQIIKARHASSRKFDDYLQILLDAKLDDQMELNEMDSKEHHHAGLTHDSLLADQKRMLARLDKSKQSESKTLPAEDILASAIFLLFVGLETTATLLTNCTYALAFHQDVQNKLYEEIRAIAELNDDKTSYVFDYDALTSCQYLDAVISETLRALTPVLQTDRVSKENYFIEKYNVTIPRGSNLTLAYHAIMNDPDNWFESQKFNPDRFMPGQREKIVPGSYCPFGLGPRHCLGMRFSLTEAKLGLAKVLMKYKFEQAPNTQYPPLSKISSGLNSAKDPRVVLKLRHV